MIVTSICVSILKIVLPVLIMNGNSKVESAFTLFGDPVKMKRLAMFKIDLMKQMQDSTIANKGTNLDDTFDPFQRY